jgi:hypothetical protein
MLPVPHFFCVSFGMLQIESQATLESPVAQPLTSGPTNSVSRIGNIFLRKWALVPIFAALRFYVSARSA